MSGARPPHPHRGAVRARLDLGLRHRSDHHQAASAVAGVRGGRAPVAAVAHGDDEVDLLGRGRALEVLLSGRDVGAEEAARIGWLDAVLPQSELAGAVRVLATRIAAMPPASVAAVKQVVDRSLVSFDDGLVAETDAFGALTAGGLHIVRMQRFLDAGGQTREAETSEWESLLEAMDD